MMKLAVIAIVLFGVSAQSNVFAADRCEQLLTPDVRRMAATFDGYDLPSEYDNASENVDYDMRHGGSGCLGAVKADFDGDGKIDTAMLLGKHNSHDETILVVIPGGRRPPKRLYMFTDVARAKLAISVVEPGAYERAGGVGSKLERGEVRRIESLRSGIGAGVIDSSEVVFFWKNARWLHVWTAD